MTSTSETEDIGDPNDECRIEEVRLDGGLTEQKANELCGTYPAIRDTFLYTLGE